MKKYILILFLILLIPSITLACDICGCGVGNSYLGILPDFRKHIFGLRYRYNTMQTHLGIGGSTSYLTTKETYQTIEAWGGWTFGKNLRLMASIPYSFNEKMNQGMAKRKDGLGDITLSGYYQVLNSRRPVLSNKLLIQSLWIGTGLKFATGKYNPADKTGTSESANLFQLGTGSYDLNIGAMYDLRLQDVGMNLNTNYKIATANKYDYQYGNKFTLNAQAYYKLRIKKVTLSPNAGAQYEKAESDMDESFTVNASGGYIWLGTVGLEAAFGKMAIGANFQTPVAQQLAKGIVSANNRVMVHFAFAL